MNELNYEDFFDLVWGGVEGEVRISLKGVSNGKWFAWPAQRGELLEYVHEHRQTDVYFTVTAYSQRTRRNQYATQGTVVYADADVCDPKNFRLHPSIILETSPGHWQAFWLLDQTHTAQEVSDASHLIAAAHKADGCDQSGWILTKILRVPATRHTKTDTHHEVQGYVSGELYSLKDIQDAYRDVDLTTSSVLDDELPDDLPKIFDLTGDKRMSGNLWTFWSTEPPASEDLSARMWRMEMDAFRLGYNPIETFVLIRESKGNKYSPDRFGETTASGGTRPYRQDPDGDLWKEVKRAYVEWQDEEASKAVEVQPVEVIDDDLFLEANVRFLSDEEEAFVNSTETFIDRYTKWARSRTDASVEYHRTLAFLLLSCVYGDKATLHLSFGKVRLNLWVLLLGDTTKTRKSTARRLMLEVLHAYEGALGETVDVGSDFTPEALVRALGDRDGKVSMVHRDEVQGWFHEMLNKAHQAGTIERLTDMYDGKVQVVLRNDESKSQKNRSNVVFNMLLMGIAEQTARVLTVDNFRSGFLTRFLWVSAPNLEMTDDRLMITQGDPDAPRQGGHDRQVFEFVKEFMGAQKQMPRGDKPIYLTPEALDRLNRWVVWVTRTLIPKTREPSNLEPTVQRMAHSIMKCAALLALHDRTDQVSLKYVLVALKYAEGWFDTLRVMSDSIADSEYSQHVNDIETFLYDGGGERLLSSVYSKFRAYPNRDVDMWIQSLESQGRAILKGQTLVLRREVG